MELLRHIFMNLTHFIFYSIVVLQYFVQYNYNEPSSILGLFHPPASCPPILNIPFFAIASEH
jgi:hypothetical protein